MARPEIQSAAARAERLLIAHPWAAAAVERVELRSDGRRVVAVVQVRRKDGRLAGLLRELASAMGPGAACCLGKRVVAGDPRIMLPVAGLSLGFGPQTFYQVNLEANLELVDSVAALVGSLGPSRVLDLFGGAGNLSLPIAAQGVPVEIVESSAPAVADARENAARLGLPVQVNRGDAWGFEAGSAFFDLALLDPPRRGAGPAMAEVCATRPRAVVLVACHPPALARDVQVAVRAGYQLASLELHDLFPLTSHVESLALLLRGS